MNIYNQDEVNIKKNSLVNNILDGKIFVYPTDTIYGIGCDATNDESVKKIREIKDRVNNPFSIIAPSKQWINDNCELNSKSKEWMDKLPGPYTLILKIKNDCEISTHVNNGMDTIGIRIPNHWISEFCTKIDKPIVTTSANRQGQDFMTSIENMDKEIKSKVDFIIYEGEIKGSPSTLVHLNKDEIEIRER